jgi:CubicO group peptidase (beta-lactamase class C family)
MGNRGRIFGDVSERFEVVKREFAEVAGEEGEELSAQLAVYVQGTCVVDLWTGPEMSGETLLGVYSASKGAAHLVVALLVQDGVLNLDQRVSHYWPEFAVEGKSYVTLRELLSHRVGLVGPDKGLGIEDLACDQTVARILGGQRPYWRPGTAFGYHALVVGALTGEVVRRATGQTIQEVFEARVQHARCIEFYLGLPENQETRFLSAQAATQTRERALITADKAPAARSLSGIAFNRHHPNNPPVWELPNFKVVRTLGPASFGGIASSRGMARMYASAINSVDGKPSLLAEDTIAIFSQIQSIGYDLVTHDHKAYGVGFHITSEYYSPLGQGSFGHSGAGGQQAFADPRNGIAYAYTRRRAPFPSAAAPENDRLIRALYSVQNFN